MKARYIRVSSKTQSTARQEAKQHPDELLFIDVISGVVPFKLRPAGKELLAAILIKDIKQISVAGIDRLGRDTLDILDTIEYFTKRGINVHIESPSLDSLGSNGKPSYGFELIAGILSSISKMERETLRQRQLEGIEQAKKAGVYTGRVKGTVESDEEVLAKHSTLVKAIKKFPDLSLRELAKLAADENGKKPSANTVRKVKVIIEKSTGQ